MVCLCASAVRMRNIKFIGVTGKIYHMQFEIGTAYVLLNWHNRDPIFIKR